MSTSQQKMLKEQIREHLQGRVYRKITKAEKKLIKQKAKYPNIYKEQ